MNEPVFQSLTKSYIVKDDDILKVEVGDSKDASKFHPQVKLIKWDGKASFSIRLDTDIIQNPISKDGIISTENVKFYELPSSNGSEEGGLEFDVEIKEKPLTNEMRFTIESKNVKFFRQGALTAWQIANNEHRPENVVGSYAVYQAGYKLTYANGKQYGNNKLGHIFRPQTIDAVGKKVWDELDITGKTLTVTIPWDFLEKAVYPIHHAAGLDIGYKTAGSSSVGRDADMVIAARLPKALITATCTVQKLKASIEMTGGNVKGLIFGYDGTDATLITNGITAAEADSDAWSQHWQELTFGTDPTLNSATSYTGYMFGVVSDDAIYVALFYDETEPHYVAWDNDNDYTTPENMLSYSQSGWYLMSIYAICTETATDGSNLFFMYP